MKRGKIGISWRVNGEPKVEKSLPGSNHSAINLASTYVIPAITATPQHIASMSHDRLHPTDLVRRHRLLI
jgi:hypothetical protein